MAILRCESGVEYREYVDEPLEKLNKQAKKKGRVPKDAPLDRYRQSTDQASSPKPSC